MHLLTLPCCIYLVKLACFFKSSITSFIILLDSSTAPPGLNHSDVADFINGRLQEADNDPTNPPHETVREYAYEGEGSIAGSLSSLGSTSDVDDQTWDHLGNWGPRFQKLAHMYSDGGED